MRLSLLIILSLQLLLGCSSHSTPSSSSLSDDTTLFKKYNHKYFPKKINEIKKYNYKMIYIDTSKKEDLQLKKTFMDFGNNLGGDGIVFEFDSFSSYEKKKYLSGILNYLNSGYNYYDSPFLIVLDENNGSLIPYKILSFSGQTNACINKSLQRIEKSIHQNVSLESAIDSFHKEKIYSCSFEEKYGEEIKDTFIELLKIIASGIFK